MLSSANSKKAIKAEMKKEDNSLTLASVESQNPVPEKVLDLRARRKLARSSRIAARTTHRFAPGQCTDYVGRQTGWVTWTGNANRWAANAARQGYNVGKEYAAPDTIIQTNESWYGHVGYVIAVDGDMVTFREWNYKGRYVETERTLNINSSKVVNIISL